MAPPDTRARAPAAERSVKGHAHRVPHLKARSTAAEHGFEMRHQSAGQGCLVGDHDRQPPNPTEMAQKA